MPTKSDLADAATTESVDADTTTTSTLREQLLTVEREYENQKTAAEADVDVPAESDDTSRRRSFWLGTDTRRCVPGRRSVSGQLAREESI